MIIISASLIVRILIIIIIKSSVNYVPFAWFRGIHSSYNIFFSVQYFYIFYKYFVCLSLMMCVVFYIELSCILGQFIYGGLISINFFFFFYLLDIYFVSVWSSFLTSSFSPSDICSGAVVCDSARPLLEI